MVCTDEIDIEELNEIYEPLCWQRCDHDPGGYKKIMWDSIMKEFDCKESPTWSNDDRTKDAAFTHRKHGDGGQGMVSQLDFIIGPKDRRDDCFIYNDEIWSTRGIITRFTQVLRKEEIRKDSREIERELVWMGIQDGGTQIRI